MAKVRKVFESDAIAHVWIYNRYKGKNGDVAVTEGRTKSYNGFQGYVSGNQSFAGDYYYSYNTVIAKRYDLGEKGILYLVSNHDYGSTTRGQQWNLWGAIPEELNGRKVYKLQFDTTERFPNGVGEGYENEWISISDFLIAQAGEMWQKAKKARNRRRSYVESGFELLVKAEKLLEFLELPYDELITKVRRELRELPVYASDLRPSNPNQHKYLRDWHDAMKYIPNLPMIAAKVFREDNPGPFGANLDPWMATLGVSVKDKVISKVLDSEVGSKLTIKLKLSDCPWANIKLVGDRVVTSLGMRLGRDEAISIYEGMLEAAKNHSPGVTRESYRIAYHKWNSYGERGSVGNHTQGLISVGCHYFHPSTLASSYLYLISERNKQNG